jgi:NADH-quinone oxidoreductase subunit N
LFSMAGIPPLAGFFGKLLIFKSAVGAGHVVLAVVGVIASVVASYYYLKLIKIMFFDAPKSSSQVAVKPSGMMRWVSIPAFVIIVGYIIWPDRLVYEATQAALSLQ